MRIALPKVTQCDANRVRIRILKPPTPKTSCVFKLLANIEVFLQTKTYKIAQYTKQVTSQACLDYWRPFYLPPFCPKVAIQGHLLITFKLSPTPHLSNLKTQSTWNLRASKWITAGLIIRWILSSPDHLGVFKFLQFPEDLNFLTHPSLLGTIKLTSPFSTLHKWF